MIGTKTMRNFVGQWHHVLKQLQKFCTKTLKKVFSNAKKMTWRNIFRHFFRANFFMFVLLITNHTVYLVQFEINLHLWVFQRAEICEIALAEAARRIWAFWKTVLVQIYSKLNSKKYIFIVPEKKCYFYSQNYWHNNRVLKPMFYGSSAREPSENSEHWALNSFGRDVLRLGMLGEHLKS